MKRIGFVFLVIAVFAAWMPAIACIPGVKGSSFSTSYDSAGNILSVTKGGSPAGSFSYSHNRISGLTYNDDGNLTNDGVNTYDYNALNQTASITNIGGTVSYQYDSLSKRILKSDTGGDTVYAYLGEQLISEYDGSNYTDSIFFEGQLLARVHDDGLGVTTVNYAHLNHLGSPIAFTDDTATVVWPEQIGGTPYEIHNYEPFGADFNDLGTPALSPQNVRYSGKLFDANTGKHYFNARYLNAVTDISNPELPPRFLSPDVIIGSPDRPQSWNRFASCLNNPVALIDPDGKRTYYFAGLGGSKMDPGLSKHFDIRDTYYNFGKNWFSNLYATAKESMNIDSSQKEKALEYIKARSNRF